MPHACVIHMSIHASEMLQRQKCESCTYGYRWYAVPFGLATSLGLTVKALDLPLTSKEANQGRARPSPWSAALPHLLHCAGSCQAQYLDVSGVTCPKVLAAYSCSKYVANNTLD